MELVWRYLGLALLGLIAGGFANYLIYAWAYFPRPISPWSVPHPVAPSRRPGDRLPVLGWLGLRRETPLHGAGFWVRPLLLEISLGLALPTMYWFYTQSGGLLPIEYRTPERVAVFASWAHTLFIVHASLAVLLVAATMIDFDEQTIPDVITVPGTLLGLSFSALPWRSFLPALVRWDETVGVAPTTFNVPWPYDDAWSGSSGLLVGLTIWGVWIFALTDRHLVLRHGLVRAIEYLVHGIRRQETSKWLLVLGVFGGLAISGVWLWGGDRWCGLLSGLVGLAAGGGTVWAVRVVAGVAMGQEAMGFGDVTLMSMIGAFLGWQAAIAAFFLAPLAAIAIVLAQFLITRQSAVPFGPYLCLGTVLAVLGWDRVWNRSLSIYAELGGIVVVVLVVALVAMAAMLMIWGQFKRWLFGVRTD